MNYKPVIGVVMALMLATVGDAFAKGHGDRNNDCRGQHSGCDGADSRQGHNKPGHAAQRNASRHMNGPDMRHERGAGPDQTFYRGDRLPNQYRTRQYVVDDWRGHHLSAPPRGYHWVQTGGDYVLVAIVSGIILQLYFGN